MRGERLDKLMRRLRECAPDELKGVCDEAGQFVRSNTEPLLRRMNLVSREEYDVQVALVGRLREQLEQMQKRIAELEAERNTSKNA